MTDTLAWQWADWDQGLIDRIFLPQSFLDCLRPGDRTLYLTFRPDEWSDLTRLVPELYSGLWRELAWTDVIVDVPADTVNDHYFPVETVALLRSGARPSSTARAVTITASDPDELWRLTGGIWNLSADYVMHSECLDFTEQDGSILVFRGSHPDLEALFTAGQRVAQAHGWAFMSEVDT